MICDKIILTVFWLPSVILFWIICAIKEYENQIAYAIVLFMAIILLIGVGRIGFSIIQGY